MQKVWVLVLNDLIMATISYCCGMIYYKTGRIKIRNVSLSVQLGFTTRKAPTREDFGRFTTFTKDSPQIGSKLRPGTRKIRAFPKVDEDCRGISQCFHCTPTHFSSFRRGKTPRQKWGHWYVIDEVIITESLIAFILILQRLASESPTVCTWCMLAWNQWRSRLSFLIGMTHQMSSEYRKWFVHVIWLALLWQKKRKIEVCRRAFF